MRPFAVLLSVFLTILIFGVGYLLAFNSPTQAPPGGSGAIAVDASGNVGIGTTSPGGKLEIEGGTRTLSLDFTGTGGFVYQTLRRGGVEKWWFSSSDTNDALHVRTPSLNVLSLLSGGNVGIGAANPGAKLEVAGQVKITGGSPGVNKILTSDASGLASWQTPAGGAGGNLSGEGRADILLANSAGEGECVVGGLKVSRALPPVNWEGARAGCPAGWWVCSAAERGTVSCGASTVTITGCRPTYGTDDTVQSPGRYQATGVPWAWVADAYVTSPSFRHKKVVNINGTAVNQSEVSENHRCSIYPVWCCSN